MVRWRGWNWRVRARRQERDITVAQLRALAADESEDAFDAVGVGDGSPVRSNRRRGVIGVRAVGRRLREQERP